MGSSYRSDLRSGGMKKWEDKLNKACTLVEEVITDIYDSLSDTGQLDNAADDGALAEKLGLGVSFIKEELPVKKSETPDGN